jgi:hypothetical protein
MVASLKKLDFVHGVETAVYEVKLPRGGSVFMSVERTNYMNDQRTVVIVDAERFLEVWRTSAKIYPYTTEQIALQSPAEWKTDYKYNHAVDGFSRGESNPVPLAKLWVTPDQGAGKPQQIGFTNGITRTIWLLANGAKSFPIECNTESAAMLHALAGSGKEPITVTELLNGYTREVWLSQRE